MNNNKKTKDEQFNIRLTTTDLHQFQEDIKQFGGNVSQSQYGELALKYFGKALKDKGVLVILSEVI